jgi:hypothetical protein
LADTGRCKEGKKLIWKDYGKKEETQGFSYTDRYKIQMM